MSTLKRFFIAYDLITPGQKYAAVEDAIAKSCTWYMKLQYSLYFVISRHTAAEMYSRVRAVQDGNDKLAVIEAANAVISTAGNSEKEVFLNLWGTPDSEAA
ncbi:MAG: hypothetical protein FD144_4008 [Rhodospirillaceae bacterium]|nr:MAG: hypothetical protein FD144_4008 [Rhodospirillaceae bacterium]